MRIIIKNNLTFLNIVFRSFVHWSNITFSIQNANFLQELNSTLFRGSNLFDYSLQPFSSVMFKLWHYHLAFLKINYNYNAKLMKKSIPQCFYRKKRF